MNTRSSAFTFFLCLLVAALFAQAPDDRIRIDQVGHHPQAPKVAVVVGANAGTFMVTRPGDRKPLFRGKLGEPKQSSYNPKTTRVADFSSFTGTGMFVLRVPGIGVSHPFTIAEDVHLPLLKASVKAYYFQRFSMPLEERYAGQWKRPASAVQPIVVHPSAASDSRPAGTAVASPRGWLDAGDHNKYIVNSGITTATLLMAYEDAEPVFKNLDLGIPESGNGLPDLLDEVLWNLRWMLTMQDPADGGVYHKCTNANFDAMVMPHETNATRYLVQKSTAAALDFAAVTARASRVFAKFPMELPGLADSCRRAAMQAWTWAKAHPAVIYDQDKINEAFDPDITTGTYGDGNVGDEWIWAAAEMTVMTGSPTYLDGLDIFPAGSDPVPAWNDVRMMGYYALAKDGSGEVQQLAKERILKKADELMAGLESSPWHAVMGGSGRSSDFVWGSNAVAANQGMLLLKAMALTERTENKTDEKDGKKLGTKMNAKACCPRLPSTLLREHRSVSGSYLTGAIANLDYLLGRNAMGYSFVTGHGAKTPMRIHHRPSDADGIDAPVPGLLAGGPNPGKQDGCTYASSLPDEAYTDEVCSYASNEVAINWNAPLVYLVGLLELYLEK